MSVRTECPRIDERELQNLLLLSFFDQRSLDETLEDIWENADYVNMHFD